MVRIIFCCNFLFAVISATGCGRDDLEKFKQCQFEPYDICKDKCPTDNGPLPGPTIKSESNTPKIQIQSCVDKILEDAKSSIDSCTKKSIPTFPTVSELIKLVEPDTSFKPCQQAIECMIKNHKADDQMKCVSMLSCSLNETKSVVCNCGRTAIKDFAGKFNQCRPANATVNVVGLPVEARRLLDTYAAVCDHPSPVPPVLNKASNVATNAVFPPNKGSQSGGPNIPQPPNKGSSAGSNNWNQPPPPPPPSSKGSSAGSGNWNQPPPPPPPPNKGSSAGSGNWNQPPPPPPPPNKGSSAGSGNWNQPSLPLPPPPNKGSSVGSGNWNQPPLPPPPPNKGSSAGSSNLNQPPPTIGSSGSNPLPAPPPPVGQAPPNKESSGSNQTHLTKDQVRSNQTFLP